MKINCAYSEIVDIDSLTPNPNNPNVHTPEQIKQFSKILKKQGQRRPVTVSKRSGFVIVGHGMIDAAKMIDAKKIAVDYQDFESEALEFSHMIADNSLKEQSKQNKKQIADKLVDIGDMDFDLDLLGFNDFKIDVNELDDKKQLKEDQDGTQCPSCGFTF